MSNRTQLRDLTVYILEEASPIRMRQVRLLKAITGMRVVGAGSDAETDLATLQALQPDVVLVGLRTGQSLRQVRLLTAKMPACTLIVLSNSGSALMRTACLRAGGNYCFDKTLEVQELRTALLEMSGTATRSSGPW
jgi:DNA-binding NarL/FixJ family response regulator